MLRLCRVSKTIFSRVYAAEVARLEHLGVQRRLRRREIRRAGRSASLARDCCHAARRRRRWPMKRQRGRKRVVLGETELLAVEMSRRERGIELAVGATDSARRGAGGDAARNTSAHGKPVVAMTPAMLPRLRNSRRPISSVICVVLRQGKSAKPLGAHGPSCARETWRVASSVRRPSRPPSSPSALSNPPLPGR